MFISILVLAEFIMRDKNPLSSDFFSWSSAIARKEWNGMTDIIPIIDPLSDRTGTAMVPECK